MLLVSAEARGRLAAIATGALGVAVPDGEGGLRRSDAALRAVDGARGVEEDREDKPRLLAVARLLDNAPDVSGVIIMGLVAMEGRSLTEAETTRSDERSNKNGLAAAPAADSAGGIDEGLQAEMG